MGDSLELLKTSVNSSSSSSSSAECSFRELEDVFLQTQTRIWLGEVLHTRLDEEIAIADLLADGKLLFQVSKVVWKRLLTKCMELRYSKAYICEPATSQKRSKRYMPYSNVDSFLKICQILGLTSIDLFTPSDVVEKRDIRRVCMCIRSVSKKARSKGLNVPDFDVVTNTIAMPTDMVGGIRKSLEQSQQRFLSSAALVPGMDSKTKFRQTHWGADYVRERDSDDEELEDAENRYNVFGLDSPASNTCNDASMFISSTESLAQGTLVNVENYISTHCISQSDDLGTHSFTRDSLDDCTSEGNYFGCPDSIVHGDDTVSVLYNGEGICPDTYLQGLNSTDRCSRYGFERRCSEEIEDAEVSSAGSLNSISSKAGILECEGLFQAEVDNLYIQLPQTRSVDTDYLGDSSTSDFESLEIIEYESFKQDTNKLQCKMKYEDIGSTSKPLPVAVCQPKFGEIQNSVVSESVGDNMFYIDSDAIKMTKVQLLSNCSDQLNCIGDSRNINSDPEILSGHSDKLSSIQRKCIENHKAINSNGSDCHGAGLNPNFVCHSPIEVSRDSKVINDVHPLTEYDLGVLAAFPNDPDVNTKVNQQTSSPSTDCFTNITENRHEGVVMVTVGNSKHFFAEKDSSRCSIQEEYRESTGCESTTSDEKSYLSETDNEKVHYISSANVEPPSITEVNRSSFNFKGTFEKSLFRTSSMSVGNPLGFDGNSLLPEIPGPDAMILHTNLKMEKDMTPLVEGILESANADDLESSLIGQSERLNLEIEGMTSPVDFPRFLEESNVPDHGKQSPNSVSLDYLNHDIPYLCVPTPNKEPCKITSSPENVEHNHNDLPSLDGNHFQVAHEACSNLADDAGNCLENINKDKEKNEKVEGNVSESNPRKNLLLKSVAGGITLVGVFLLFQLGRKVNITRVPSIKISKTNSGEAVKQKTQQGGKGDAVHPGDKLRFKS